ncbi:uncharacterized protein METZ01_LOCUS443173, partial [marine metagenome]
RSHQHPRIIGDDLHTLVYRHHHVVGHPGRRLLPLWSLRPDTGLATGRVQVVTPLSYLNGPALPSGRPTATGHTHVRPTGLL